MNSKRMERVKHWQPYFKAVFFVLPALVLWEAASVFLFPKLETIWRDGGGSGSDGQGIMDTVTFLMRYVTMVFLGAFVLLVVLDFLARPWARYRAVAVSALAFVFNAAVLVGFSAMCMAAIFIAPALMRMK